MRKLILPLAALATAVMAMPAHAYIGPGAGLSLLSAFWALLAATLAAVAFVVWYPIRRLLRARQPRPGAPAATMHTVERTNERRTA